MGLMLWFGLNTVSGLTPGKEYFFSAYVTSVYPPPVGTPATAPALLAFSINGTELIPDISTATTGDWDLFYRSWIAPRNWRCQTYLSLTELPRLPAMTLRSMISACLQRSPASPNPPPCCFLDLGWLGWQGLGESLRSNETHKRLITERQGQSALPFLCILSRNRRSAIIM